MTAFAHVPVMVAEVLAALALGPGLTVVDGTAGGGGHLAAIRDALGPGSQLIGLDLDPAALAACRARLGDDVLLLQRDFGDLAAVAAEHAPEGIDRIFCDLGVSRDQLVSERFSFRGGGRLDFRLDPAGPTTAADLLAELDEAELERMLRELGDEPFARRIAAGIVAARREAPVETADQLVELVRRAYPAKARHGRAHLATRTFQALRLAVNDLYGSLERLLADGPGLLRPGGRLVLLCYQSGEDRRVKQAFRELSSQAGYTLGSRKAVQPGAEECRDNRSARSARLRWLIKELV